MLLPLPLRPTMPKNSPDAYLDAHMLRARQEHVPGAAERVHHVLAQGSAAFVGSRNPLLSDRARIALGAARAGVRSWVRVSIPRATLLCPRAMPSPAVASRARRNGTAGRIAHVTIIHPPTDARIFERQCRSLAALGHEVHLLAPGAGQRQQDGVRLHALTPTWERPHLRQQVPLQLRTWRQAWRLDAGTYHLHDPHLIPLGVALSLRGARVIYDVHEDYPRHARSKLAGRPVRAHLKAALWTALEAVARRRLDGFVCASETIARRFAGDVAVVHNHPRSGDVPRPGRAPLRAAPRQRRLRRPPAPPAGPARSWCGRWRC